MPTKTLCFRIKTGKVADSVLSWNTKGVFHSNFNPLYTAFLHTIKLFGYRIGIKFNKDLLAIEQNNYLTKIVNIYTVYELNDWSRNPTINFKFKTFQFGATNIVKTSDRKV